MFNLAVGFLAALVVIQFFPRVALVGKWLVARGRDFMDGLKE